MADKDCFKLSGKVALITGASSGIGAATAIYFSNLGASLSLTGRILENLEMTANQCRQDGPHEKPLLIKGDMCKDEDVISMLEKTIQKYGKLDILINNAGILERGNIENTSMDQFDRVMNLNIRSVYNLTMKCVPHLIASKGSIVNVSSVNGIRSFQGVLAYNISKAALDQFTKCVALELASKHVRVNSVNPGVIITNIHRRAGQTEDEYANFLEHSKETHALGRPGTAMEVAKAIAFLANSDSSFCTGVLLPVDGGRHAMCPR